jgi:hypothetical protein
MIFEAEMQQIARKAFRIFGTSYDMVQQTDIDISGKRSVRIFSPEDGGSW